MPPKKADAKGKAPVAGGAPVTTISEDELAEAAKLPQLNDFVFSNMYAFRMLRNQNRLDQQIGKMFCYFDKEDPDYNEEWAEKYRSIDMAQLLGQAAARGTITAEEAEDFATVDEPRRSEVLAQATVESVAAIQLERRRKKADEQAANKVTDTEGKDLEGTVPEVEMAVMLRDFPKSADEVAALMKADFDLNGVFLIEELFGRDIDNSDEEDEINAKRELDILGPVAKTPEEGEEPSHPVSPAKREKLFKGLKYRADQFEQLIAINRLAKKAGKNFIVKRCQFRGPANPMTIPEPTEEVPEPEIDQDLKAAEFKLYDDFAAEQRADVDALALRLTTYKGQLARAREDPQQLWPLPPDPEAEERRKAQEEQRESQLREAAAKEAEAVAAAAAAKGKKGAAVRKSGDRPPSATEGDKP